MELENRPKTQMAKIGPKKIQERFASVKKRLSYRKKEREK